MPIEQLAAVAREYDIPVHSDAIQAVPHVPVNFATSGLSAMSIAAHKFGGPQGVGALLLGRTVACVPLLYGGGHERDVRSGTHDTASIVAMAAALKDTVDGLAERHAHLVRFREKMIAGVRALDPEVIVNGTAGADRLGHGCADQPGVEWSADGAAIVPVGE